MYSCNNLYQYPSLPFYIFFYYIYSFFVILPSSSSVLIVEIFNSYFNIPFRHYAGTLSFNSLRLNYFYCLISPHTYVSISSYTYFSPVNRKSLTALHVRVHTWTTSVLERMHPKSFSTSRPIFYSPYVGIFIGFSLVPREGGGGGRFCGWRYGEICTYGVLSATSPRTLRLDSSLWQNRNITTLVCLFALIQSG